MINYRQIFNPSNTIYGILLSLILILLLIFINTNKKEGIYLIGKTTLISSIIVLIIAFILKLSINILIPYDYKIFIEVISTRLFQNLIITSSILLIISILIMIVTKRKKSTI